ncbi:HAD family hydrolase [Arsenicicoccus sp. oral taxon 190]|uniref:HAD family hydrolase n=1 Tax=Arsenicicoccus sp. oral taxon 190 TaxID=1658671 RepID=UPI00067B38C6|nr:HAD family hydrolase [Arsenicicoccus sp. oral taxon 190]
MGTEGRLRAVLLDLDGTLVDHGAALARAFAEVGRELDVDFTGLDRAGVRPALPGRHAMDHFRAAYARAIRPYADARPVVDQLLEAGLRVGILADGGDEDLGQASAALAALGVAADQVTLLTPSDLPAARPDPRAYLAACAAVGASPQETVVVGDDHALDVRGALDAGLAAVWVNRRDRRDSEDAPTLPTLDGLPGLLATL